MTKIRLVRGGVAALGVALLAGCGGSSPKASAPTAASLAPSSSSVAPSSSSVAPSPSSPATSPASLAHLEKIVLHAADLPARWKGAAHQAGVSDAADDAALTRCVGARNTSPDKVAEAHSADFALGSASISSNAASYRSQSDLDSDRAVLRSPKLSSCFEQLIKNQFASTVPPGTKIESASVKITPGSAGGPANVVATGAGTVKISVTGQSVSLYVTVAFITGPLIEAEVDTFNVGAPVPTSVVKSLVTAVATRAAKG